MSKNKVEKPQREVTKRQLSHWQREHRLQRIVIITGIVILAAILIIISAGIYLDKYKPYHTTVLKVGDTEYSMDYYIDMLVLLWQGQPQILQQMSSYATQQTAQMIEQNQILMEAAAKLDTPIIVSDSEIQKYITDNQLTSEKAMYDRVHFQLLIQKLQSEYFDKQIGPAEQRALLAMFLESQKQVDEVKASIENGKNFNDLAAELSLETESKDKKGDFGWIPQGVLSTILGSLADTVLDDSVFSATTLPGVLNQVAADNQTKNIGYWVLKVTEKNTSTNQVHLFAMLLGSQAAAEDMILKLNAGADFVTEGKTNSLYKNASEDGGDLGFITKGVMGDAVDAVIFPEDSTKTLPLNSLSSPIADTSQTTSGGIWLFEVTEINPSKEITGDSRTTLVNQKLDAWASQVWKDNQSRIENLLNADQESFAVVKALARMQ